MLQSMSRQFSLALLGILAITVTSPAFAQVNSSATLSEQTLREGNNERSAYSLGNSNLNMTQLIHNLNLNNNTNAQEFQRRQNESLNNAFSGYNNGQPRNLGLDTLDFTKPRGTSNSQPAPKTN